jgi:hypothetical protein
VLDKRVFSVAWAPDGQRLASASVEVGPPRTLRFNLYNPTSSPSPTTRNPRSSIAFRAAPFGS